MDLSTYLGIDCSTTADDTARSPWCCQRHSVPSVIRSSCSFKLICSSPGFAVLNHHTFPSLFPRHLVPTVDPSVLTFSWTRHLVKHRRTHLRCVRLHVSQDTRLVATRRTLDFWLSVRLNVNLHDVLNLSSISIDVLDLSFPQPQGR